METNIVMILPWYMEVFACQFMWVKILLVSLFDSVLLSKVILYKSPFCPCVYLLRFHLRISKQYSCINTSQLALLHFALSKKWIDIFNISLMITWILSNWIKILNKSFTATISWFANTKKNNSKIYFYNISSFLFFHIEIFFTPVMRSWDLRIVGICLCLLTLIFHLTQVPACDKAKAIAVSWILLGITSTVTDQLEENAPA